MSIKGVIVLIVLAIVVFVFGVGLGSTVSKPKTGTGQSSQIVKDLSSKVIPSVSAYGTITNLSGRNITLSYQGDSIMIPITADAKIFSFITTPVTKTTTASQTIGKPITFSDLKIGNTASITIKILPSDNIEGNSVVVLPAVQTVAPAPVTTKTTK